jgi:TIR domain
MKVFISHSSKDKWAARRISEDIVEIGCETFLDEKDIKSGNAIDASIKKHLKECEDFLIILSPASIKSEWVLIELGGALALEKNIIPILLYVGANVIPDVIGLKLARDINDIDRYYNEIFAKLNNQPKPKQEPEVEPEAKIKSGSKVIVTSILPGDYIGKGYNVDWAEEMNNYLGHEAIVTHIFRDGLVQLNIDDGGFYWAADWLTLKS